LLGVMISGTIEGLLLPIIFSITGYTVNDLMTNAWVNIVAFIPVFLVTALIYWLSSRYNFVLLDFENRSEYSG
jgi:hypothetical protein